MISLRFLLLSFLVLLFFGCSQIQKATDIITKPTAREVYQRSFEKENKIFKNWNALNEIAKKDSLEVSLPFVETGQFSLQNNEIYSYNFLAQEGERVVISVQTEIDSTIVFLDLFQVENDSLASVKLLQSNFPNTKTINQVIETTGIYKIIVQPEIYTNSTYVLKMYTQPTYAFPVINATNKNIQSFWGASRAGGRRTHKGNDIFAPRGTPVIAVTDGRISSTGNRGLGGKQVWLRDGLFGGKSLYYAHLDSIAVRAGKAVKIGDTLGFVGNTGNAKTTAPHLHFGIYKGYSGAIDPLPFIKMNEIPKATNQLHKASAYTTNAKSTLRTGVSTKFKKITDLQEKDTVSVFGKIGNWYHISVKDTLRGFMHKSLLKEISSN